jgi:hypothetical protein
VLQETENNRKVTSVSFDKILWANFRAEVKHRGEQVQDVFDRLMRNYVEGQNTKARKTVTVMTEGEVWRPHTRGLSADDTVREAEDDSQEDSDTEEEEELEEEDAQNFAVEPHVPGAPEIEIDDEPEEEEENEEGAFGGSEGEGRDTLDRFGERVEDDDEEPFDPFEEESDEDEEEEEGND